MTTNVGSEILMSGASNAAAMAVNLAPPEFMNRLDLIIFNPLSKETVLMICCQLVEQLEAQLEKKSHILLVLFVALRNLDSQRSLVLAH
jgi:ATP-dependent Clp protease ATP-binding subunit ClpA